MEVLLQYLDDIDDIIGAIALLFERIRGALLTIFTLLVAATAVSSGVLLALFHPRAALATCVLLLVALLYRLVRVPHSSQAPVA